MLDGSREEKAKAMAGPQPQPSPFPVGQPAARVDSASPPLREVAPAAPPIAPPSTPPTTPPTTPMMRQYLETKALHPDAILFFRLGDFYEMFYEDAVKASELLQIALTSRSKGDERVPMCGVPYHAARRYIAKLIDHGLRVAICDQMEAPGPGPGIVRREVTRVITPGMVLDEESLQAGENNYLAAVHFGDSGLGAALLDASTGEFSAFEAQSTGELAEVLGRADPRELLVCEEELNGPALKALRAALPKTAAVASLDRAAFEPRRAAAFLKAHFQVSSLDGFGLSAAPDATAAAGAALRYLKATQKTPAAHVDRLSLLRPDGYLVLDDASRSNLEVLRNLRDGGRQGSLLSVLDRTFTAPGARKLARWLVAPLRSPPEINARLDAVEELVGRALLREELSAHLRHVGDLERLCARLSLGAGNARDLRSLALSLAALPKIAEVLKGCGSPLLGVLVGPLGSLSELAAVLQSAVVDEPPATVKDGGFIRAGYNPELDELVGLSSSGRDFLLRIESRERERTGIASLKVRYNRVLATTSRSPDPISTSSPQTTSANRPPLAPSATSPPSCGSTKRRSYPRRRSAAPWSSSSSRSCARAFWPTPRSFAPRRKRSPPATRCFLSPAAPSSTAIAGRWWTSLPTSPSAPGATRWWSGCSIRSCSFPTISTWAKATPGWRSSPARTWRARAR